MSALLAAAIALLSLTVSPARGQLGLTLLNDMELADDALLMPINAPYGRAINGVSFQTEPFLTYNGYQYATYYQAIGGFSENLMLARRDLTTTTWEVFDTGEDLQNGDNSWDAHNVSSIGISGDGRIHIAWDMHNNTLKYMNTDTGVATNPGGTTWNSGILNSERNSLNSGDPGISDVTYPRFITKDNGDMIMTYRTGGSGNGDMNFATYDESLMDDNWDSPHQIINGTNSITYTDPIGSSNNRNAYLNGVNIGPDGDIHITWTWREDAGGTNHDIMYAYSEDGGNTWLNNNGVQVGSVGSPIDLNSPGITVVSMDRRNTLMNQQAQTVDADGGVHAIMWHADDANMNSVGGFTTGPAAYFHYYRDPDTGMWTRNELPTSREVGSRPDIAYDADGNLFVTYLSPGPGDGTGVLDYYTDGDLIVAAATAASGYTDWSIIHTDTRDFAGEPFIDQSRLLNDGVLSIFVQENDDGNTLRTTTPLHVIEFDVTATVGDLFWAGDVTGQWDTNNGSDWDTTGNDMGNAVFLAGNDVTFDNGASTFTVNVASPVSPGSVLFNNTGGNPYTVTGAAINGSGGMTVDNGGTVTLANAGNNYTGDTNINSGTLALTGSATISASPNINVSAGATLDVTGTTSGGVTLNSQTLTIDGDVDGDVVATNNSTVNVNSDNSMNGDVTVQSNSLLAGAGTITGNVVAQSGIVRVGGVGLAVSPSQFIIDDFESYALGNVVTVASPPWTAHQGTTDADIEDDGTGNQVLAWGDNNLRGVSRDMPADGLIENDEVATFFFRVNSETDDPDHNVGLGDQASTGDVDFDDFEAQIRFYEDSPGTFRVDARDGGGFTAPLATGLSLNTWYNVWVVVDQTTDTYDVYLNEGAGDADGGDLIGNNLDFRIGTTNALDKILALSNNAPIDNGVKVDDLTYLDGVDLTNPLGGLDPGLVAESVSLTVEGDFTMSAAATLELDIVSPSILDLLAVTGNFAADGTLDVTLQGGAPAPQLGDMFDILDFGSASGMFDTLNLPTLDEGLVWETSNLLTTGILEVAAFVSPPGDADGDGDVDLDDYNIMSGNMYTNVAGGASDGDFDEDGDVDFEDFVIQALNFGDWPSAEETVGDLVPEPGSIMFLGLALIWTRRGKRRP